MINKPTNFMQYSFLFTILVGYLIMAFGDVNSFLSIKLAPTILLIGYLIIIPISIFYKK